MRTLTLGAEAIREPGGWRPAVRRRDDDALIWTSAMQFSLRREALRYAEQQLDAVAVGLVDGEGGR